MEPLETREVLAAPFPQFIDPTPSATNNFGAVVVPLSTGNVVVTSPGDNFNTGAVYLFNGSTGALISSIKGTSGGDRVGSGGVTALAGGNFVISSPDWSAKRGAATWGSGTTGVSGVVSSANSLVGSVPNDAVSFDGITPLANGNYVVTSSDWDGGVLDRGAVTWGNGATGIVGAVSETNSLVGSSTFDWVGSGNSIFGGGSTVVALANGNYAVFSPLWDNQGTGAANAGAVTICNGATGLTGVISAANSLVGESMDDRIGCRIAFFTADLTSVPGLIELPNGNLVLRSSYWDNGGIANVGAATFINGSTGFVGTLSAANSLIGSSLNDRIGGVSVLENGNYVVSSSEWDNGPLADAGAVTLGSGTTGISGVVSAANSLIGGTAGDQVGIVTALKNGNFVVTSPRWDNGPIVDAGAATFVSGTVGLTGLVSIANSLVGTATDDLFDTFPIPLANGNYVIPASRYDVAGVVDAGAAVFGNGTMGVAGAATPLNSLVGTTAGDRVGSGLRALANGNYVVHGTEWDNGSASDAGAATFGNGVTGVTGPITAANSLVGTSTDDRVGSHVTELANGHFVIGSSAWDSGLVVDAGAATFANGTTGITGTISAANSLIGGSAGDRVGDHGVVPLPSGNYLVESLEWNHAAGAITFGNGATGIKGVVSAANSLVGTAPFDLGGATGQIVVLANGNYVVAAPFWDNGAIADAGAVTFGSGTTGITGAISPANSLVGSTAADSVSAEGITALASGGYVVLSRNWDNGGVVNAGAVTFGNGTTGVSGTINSVNSSIGNTSTFLGITPDNTNGTFIARFLANGQLRVGSQIDGLAPRPPSIVTAAAAAPNPVTGSQVALSVLGTDDLPEANLTYTWSATSKPVDAAEPVYSANGTNAAKNITTTFPKPGAYTIQAEVRDSGGLTVVSSVNVTVNNDTPTIATPAAAAANPAAGVQSALSVVGADGFGEANLTYTWSVLTKPDGAPDPAFSANGANAAKNTSITVAQPGSYDLRVTVSDGSLSVTSEMTLVVDYTLGQRDELPADVTGDTRVNASDILAIANFFIAFGSGSAPTPSPDDDPKYLYDSNADGRVNAQDLLAIINYIIANPTGGSGGEGEAGPASVAAVSASEPALGTPPNDLLALLADDIARRRRR
jgi:hypothetical protein